MSTDMRRDEGQYYPYGKRVMPAEHPGGDMKHADFEGINDLPERFTDEDVRTKLNTVLGALRGTSAALAIGLAAFTLAASGDPLAVHKARKGSVYNDQEIVTDVTFDAAIPSVALTNETLYVDGWKTNVVTRRSNGAVDLGSKRAIYSGVGEYSVAMGIFASAVGNYSCCEGFSSYSYGEYSHASGYGARANSKYSWIWQGRTDKGVYDSHGEGTFNVNPVDGVDGFWIGETNFTQHVRNIAGSVIADMPAIPSVALTNETLYVNGWKTNVVTRRSNGAVDISGTSRSPGTGVGAGSIASGYRVSTPGAYSLAWGYNSRSLANYARAYGSNSSADREYSIASGIRAAATNEYALSWQGGPTDAIYFSHGVGTFNINPFGGVDGFWIGETNFTQHVRNIAGAGGGSAAPKRIAMFIVPVNQKPQINSFNSYPAYGFELKATTNNFARAANEAAKLQFYAQSEIADTGSPASGSSLGIDRMKLYMTTTNETSDIRSLDRIDNTIPFVGKELQEVVVLVDATCLVRHPEDNGAWLSEDNEDLTW
ncbi:MAG: hypothetical protein IJI36_05495 [Kiritimatiellae bacterium]|nr:hypothetical protein [Kiritimatiellia bacterium]